MIPLMAGLAPSLEIGGITIGPVMVGVVDEKTFGCAAEFAALSQEAPVVDGASPVDPHRIRAPNPEHIGALNRLKRSKAISTTRASSLGSVWRNREFLLANTTCRRHALAIPSTVLATIRSVSTGDRAEVALPRSERLTALTRLHWPTIQGA